MLCICLVNGINNWACRQAGRGIPSPPPPPPPPGKEAILLYLPACKILITPLSHYHILDQVTSTQAIYTSVQALLGTRVSGGLNIEGQGGLCLHKDRHGMPDRPSSANTNSNQGTANDIHSQHIYVGVEACTPTLPHCLFVQLLMCLVRLGMDKQQSKRLHPLFAVNTTVIHTYGPTHMHTHEASTTSSLGMLDQSSNTCTV